MFCAQCGTQLKDGAKFCGNCGTSVGAVPQAAPAHVPPPPPPAPAAPAASAHAGAQGGAQWTGAAGGAGAGSGGGAAGGGFGGGSQGPAYGAGPGAVPPVGDLANGIIARVKNILLTPATEWPVIANEPKTPKDIYLFYVAPLVAIGVIAGLIGNVLIGSSIGLGRFRMGIGIGLVSAIMTFALTFVSVFLISWLVNLLAPSFGGQKDSLRALKVTAYAFTPGWVAGILNIIPMLGLLGIIAGLYGLYLLYLGLPVLMGAPKDKSIGYTIVVVICAIVMSAIVGMLSACVIGGAAMMGGGLMGGMAGTHAKNDTDAAAEVVSKMMGGKTDADKARMSDAMKALEKMGEQADAAEKAAKAAGKDPGAAAANAVDASAAMAAVSTMMAGGKNVEPVDFHKLKDLLPESLPNMKRDEASGQSGEALGMKGSSAKARYSDVANGSITIEIADLGSLSGLAALAGKFDPNMEKETDNGYERTRKVDGNLVHEQYNRKSKSGEISVMMNERFAVTVNGDGVEPAALLAALKSVDTGRLGKLAKN